MVMRIHKEHEHVVVTSGTLGTWARPLHLKAMMWPDGWDPVSVREIEIERGRERMRWSDGHPISRDRTGLDSVYCFIFLFLSQARAGGAPFFLFPFSFSFPFSFLISF